jgi:hypothetical protein
MPDKSKGRGQMFPLLEMGMRLTISGQKTICVKRLNGGCQKKIDWKSLIKDVKVLRGPQSQGIKNEVKFMNMVCHGQYLFLQVLFVWPVGVVLEPVKI